MSHELCLSVSQMKGIELFDDIEYMYIKHIINDDDFCIDVNFELLKAQYGYYEAEFKFEIKFPLYTKDFVINKEYKADSVYARELGDLLEFLEDAGTEDDD